MGTASKAAERVSQDHSSGGVTRLGLRAARTRSAILDATRKLFLDQGYAGTRINNITEACGISRAGFYTYFKDKREVFNVIGETAYRDVLEVVERWSAISNEPGVDEVAEWVRSYFAFMDTHGAFVLSSSQLAPQDEEFRATGRRIQMRVAFLLGVSLRQRQIRPTDAPEALGLATLAMLDRSWYYSRVQELPVGDEEMIRTVADVIVCSLGRMGAD